MCGLPGSGKTTKAKQLEKELDAVRFTLDEFVIGKNGSDYPPEKHSEFEAQAKEEITEKAKGLLSEGKTVILDFGFWKKKDRDWYRDFGKGLDAEVEIVYMDVPLDELIARTQIRNTESEVVKHQITPEMLQDFLNMFEGPEGEDVISNR